MNTRMTQVSVIMRTLLQKICFAFMLIYGKRFVIRNWSTASNVRLCNVMKLSEFYGII